MSNKPFISARIPEKLLEQVEIRSNATGETKTDILVDALTEYLKPKDVGSEGSTDVDKRLSLFERWTAGRLAGLEDRIDALRIELLTLSSPEGVPASLPQPSKKVTIKRLMPSSSKSESIFDGPVQEI